MANSIRESNSIFDQPWWLEAVAPGRWDQVTVENAGQVIARMPYVVEKKLGLTIIKQPQLTQTLGPWLKQAESLSNLERLSHEHSLYGQLIDALPRHHVFAQNFHHSVTNWLPFYWKGYNQTTKYSYVIDDLTDVKSLANGFDKRTSSNIRKAERSLTIVKDIPIATVVAMATKTFERQGKRLPYSSELVHSIHEAALQHARVSTLAAVDEWGIIHAASFVVGDESRAYLLVTGQDPELRNSGAGELMTWAQIKEAAEWTRVFDFEGSMIPGIERFYRRFGAAQSAYSGISYADRLVRVGLSLRGALAR